MVRDYFPWGPSTDQGTLLTHSSTPTLDLYREGSVTVTGLESEVGGLTVLYLETTNIQYVRHLEPTSSGLPDSVTVTLSFYLESWGLVIRSPFSVRPLTHSVWTEAK